MKVIEVLGRDDSRRAAEVFVDWSLRSLKMQQGQLTKALDEAQKDFGKVEKLMKRAYGKVPPGTWRSASDRDAWAKVTKQLEAARTTHAIEGAVRFALGEALRAVQ